MGEYSRLMVNYRTGS